MNTHPVLLKLARQGDPRAIAALMNDALREQEVWVKATRDDRNLQVMLKAPRSLDQSTCVAFIMRGLRRLQTSAIDQIRVYAWQTYADFPDWVMDFSLEQSPSAAETKTETIEVSVQDAAATVKSPALDVARSTQSPSAVKFGVVVAIAVMLYFVVASV